MRDFWPDETRRVTEAYPQLEKPRDRPARPDLDPEDAERCGAVVRTWRGVIQPFPEWLDRDELLAIIFDLYNDIDVMVAGGALRHDSNACQRSTHPVPVDLIPQRTLTDSYDIELAYTIPPARPIVRGLRPRLTVDEYPDMPHPVVPTKSLCIAYPPRNHWDLRHHGARLYFDWTSIYLAKHTLWLEARERNGFAKWPGEGMGPDYDPEEEIKAPATGECSCNSGRRYGKCHLPFDVENVNSIRRGLPSIQRRSDIQFYRSLDATSE